jgi:hypothetical protein
MPKGNKKNHENAGRKPKFKLKYGKVKRITISIPVKPEVRIRQAIDVILEPYLL